MYERMNIIVYLQAIQICMVTNSGNTVYILNMFVLSFVEKITLLNVKTRAFLKFIEYFFFTQFMVFCYFLYMLYSLASIASITYSFLYI